jgi:group I intron endonuclease
METSTVKSGIYQIVNKVNGKVYVGSAVNINERWYEHRRTLNKGTHANVYLQRSWCEHGADAFVFEIVEIVADAQDLIAREQFWLDRQCVVSHGYNICRIAGSTLGKAHSEETKNKISTALTGKSLPSETRAKISAAKKGHKFGPMSEEHKARISTSKKGKPVATKEQHATLANRFIELNKARIGVPLSEEHRAKIKNSVTVARALRSAGQILTTDKSEE